MKTYDELKTYSLATLCQIEELISYALDTIAYSNIKYHDIRHGGSFVWHFCPDNWKFLKAHIEKEWNQLFLRLGYIDIDLDKQISQGSRDYAKFEEQYFFTDSYIFIMDSNDEETFYKFKRELEKILTDQVKVVRKLIKDKAKQLKLRG